jgi:hypothetical protein
VAEGAPKAGKQILAVVADSVPALQPYLQAVTAKYSANDGNVPVQAILSQSYDQALASGALVPAIAGQPDRGQALAQTTPSSGGFSIFSSPIVSAPVVGPPFTSTNGATNFSSTIGTNEAPGGRTYAAP